LLTGTRHFSHLYRSLKDRYVIIGQYKFPNKSVFHTFSQFTKDRRRSGFEEFLNLVLSIRPMPPEMEDFLEVDDHQSATATSSTLEINNRNLSPSSTLISYLPETVTQSSSSSSLRNRKQKLSSSSTATTVASPVDVNAKGRSGSSVIAKNEKLGEKLKKKMFFVIMSSYIATTLLYALLIYTSLVDVTSTTTGFFISLLSSSLLPHHPSDRIVLTMLSLGASVSLLRLSKLKRESKKQ
jgi:hypothetical protein